MRKNEKNGWISADHFCNFAAIFVKWSEAPATILSMYRMYLASILLLPIIYVNRKEFSKISKKEWLILLAAGVFLALHFALWFESLKLTTVASSTIILSLQFYSRFVRRIFNLQRKNNYFNFNRYRDFNYRSSYGWMG